MSVKQQIVSRIYGKGRGNVFTPIDFADLGNRGSIGVALLALSRSGTIRRLHRGIYDYPKTHPEIGLLTPPPEMVAQAVARGASQRIQPAGAFAANMLGLSEQVPARVVFLTDGRNRKITIGRQVIELRKATARHLALAGRMSGTVIQALRYLGEKHVTSAHIAVLSRVLSAEDRLQLRDDARLAPAWMRPHLTAVAKGASHA